MDEKDLKVIAKGLCRNDDSLFHDKCWALKAVYEGFILRLVPAERIFDHLKWRYDQRIRLRYGFLGDKLAGFLCNTGEQELWEICNG